MKEVETIGAPIESVKPHELSATTVDWLISKGFQKLKTTGEEVLFKKDELYIQHYQPQAIFILRKPTWYRCVPMPDGVMWLSGTKGIGYGAQYRHLVEQHYFNIHGKYL